MENKMQGNMWSFHEVHRMIHEVWKNERERGFGADLKCLILGDFRDGTTKGLRGAWPPAFEKNSLVYILV